MASEIVERVWELAQKHFWEVAQSESAYDHENLIDWGLLSDTREIVAAMREPSAAMLDAARDWSLKKYGKSIGNDGAAGCWQAMIDGMLNSFDAALEVAHAAIEDDAALKA